MECMLSLTPINKAYKSFKDIYAQITPKDLQQLDLMCEFGVNTENQIFYMSLSINPLELGRHNYDLIIEVLTGSGVTQYDVINAMTCEKSDTDVEFVVNKSVKKSVD